MKARLDPWLTLAHTQRWHARQRRPRSPPVSLIRKRVEACLFSLKAKGIARDAPTTGPYKGWELVA
jgi:hypothetical protein